MAPLHCIDLHAPEQAQLLAIARRAIHAGLHLQEKLEVDLQALPTTLNASRAVFVTLTLRERLRGCIGTIEPVGPLAQAVADSAHSAAFGDPRFPELQVDEFEATSIQISVLTPMQPLPAASRRALAAELQPNIDGLLLQDRQHRSTFLPSVWEQLPDPEEFLDHLLAKAGLPVDHWSPTLQFHRYRTVCFSEDEQNGSLQAPA